MSSGRRRHGATFEAVAVLILALAGIYVALLPLGSGTWTLPAPDLAFCLVVVWVARRPAEAPLWAVLLIGLAGDLLMSRPLGLGALGLLLATEAMRRGAGAWPASGAFAVEWLVATALFLAVTLGAYLALEVTLADSPGLGPVLRLALSTALAYPLVAALAVWGLGLRGGPRSRGGDRLGRLS